MDALPTPGAKLRAALVAESPLQVVGTINAYTARMAQACGYQGDLSFRRWRRRQFVGAAGSWDQYDG